MGYELYTSEELAKRVAKRRQWLAKVLQSAQELTQKHGRLLEREERSDYIHTVHHLEGFNNFSFRFDDGRSMFCNGTATIWWSGPTPLPINVDQDEPVLRVRYSGMVAHIEVVEVFSSTVWDRELDYTLEHKDDLFRLAEEKKLDEAGRRRLEEERLRKRRDLEFEAKCLMIS